MNQGIERVRILGVPVDHVDMRRTLDCVDTAIRDGIKGRYILAVNPEKVMSLRKNPQHLKVLEGAFLLIPDGIGVVFAMKWLYGLTAERVPGSELMPNICREAQQKGYRIFIYGSHEEVSREAVDRLLLRYPGLNIVGRCNGYISESDMPGLIKDINNSKADILFVALGSPKQELWMMKWLPQLNVKICQGIGGTLDTITGRVKRAPAIFCKFGLEWLYRLIKEPTRIRRQIVLLVFAWKIFIETIKQRLKV